MLAVSLVLPFRVDGLDPAWRVLAATGCTMLFYTGYSLLTVQYMAIAAEISRDYPERTSIRIYRAVFGIIASLIGTSMPPPITASAAPGRSPRSSRQSTRSRRRWARWSSTSS